MQVTFTLAAGWPVWAPIQGASWQAPQVTSGETAAAVLTLWPAASSGAKTGWMGLTGCWARAGAAAASASRRQGRGGRFTGGLRS